MTKQLGGGDPAPPATQTSPATPFAGGPDDAEPHIDRLRYLDAATRRIARGMNLDETLHELCHAAVPAFTDTTFVHLYAPCRSATRRAPPPATCGCTARPARHPGTRAPGGADRTRPTRTPPRRQRW